MILMMKATGQNALHMLISSYYHELENKDLNSHNITRSLMATKQYIRRYEYAFVF